MASSPNEPVDLLDLKLLPAWVKESAEAKPYEQYEGEEKEERSRDGDERDRHSRKPKSTRGFEQRRERSRATGSRRPQDRHRPREHGKGPPGQDRAPGLPPKPLAVEIRFRPHPRALENVTAQIKSGSVAYSLFALARLFLEKPERYDVHLTGKPESALYQLGENGAVSVDREFLERNAFRFAQADFYKIDISESEPIKGSFTNVARCKLSRTLLGPTNHHSYQARLRNLYEQRFRRRMSFADYQRQIEIVSDPAAVEQWREGARKITTFTTVREEPPLTFSSETEAERHFHQKYLPDLARKIEQITIEGVPSRKLADRLLERGIEDAWARERRSPSQMMQELAARFREAGLHIFRHRKGMLFVSPIRNQSLVREGMTLSPMVGAILETLTSSPRINRKELAEKVIVDLSGEEAESRKRALASDLHWLIHEGHVIEFNDGSLDLPRAKQPKPEAKTVETAAAAVDKESAEEKNVPAAVGSGEPLLPSA